jgi:hypothetical protein
MRSPARVPVALPTEEVAPISASACGAAALMRGTAACTSAR